MQLINRATPLQELKSQFLEKYGVRILVKREDQNHKLIMGNKWHKLRYNLMEAQSGDYETLVTYGGAYSNHILATAAAGKEFGFQTIGIIRGNELNKNSNPTLEHASRLDMQLFFVNRYEFSRLKSELAAPIPLEKKAYFLPEGGTNDLAIRGCSEILQESEIVNCDIVVVPIGTGGTFAGILKSLKGSKMLYGISALKGDWIGDEINKLLNTHSIRYTNYQLFHDTNFGGYGKFDPRLIQFILDFEQQYGIILDPVYTGKMLFSIWEMIKNEQIAYGTTFLIIHTGGLQGIAGFNARHGTELSVGA